MYFTATLLTFLVGSANIHSTLATIENDASNESSGNLRAARVTSARAVEYDCSEGCDSIIDPVCANGITFQNACIAQCQGVKLLAPGACESDAGKETTSHRFVQRKTMDTTGQGRRIEARVLNLHAEEGFKYIGSEENGEFTEADEAAFQKQVAKEMDKPGDSPEYGSVMRYTADGHTYVAESSRAMIDAYEMEFGKGESAESMEEESFEEPPMATEMGADSILGADTRFQVTPWPATRWPYWRIVAVGDRHCSGTIIGKNKILTNAHCVYNTGTKRWTVPSRVYPGRNGSSPWGHWNVKHATILTSYINGSWQKDYAIITTKNDNWTGRDIGDYMGRFPLTYTSCSVLDGEARKKRIVGYPGDKPSGTMWDSGACANWYYSCGSERVYHQCDTYYGNSGSGMLLFGSTNYVSGVVGVHAWGSGGGSWNSGPAFSSSIAAMLNSW